MTDSGTATTPPDDLAGAPLVTSSLDFPVVGIGASAGGLAALTQLFEALPNGPDMAFVVVLHLSPRHTSHAHELIQRVTRMPCVQVTAPCRIEPNHVYVIPPNQNLAMTDGQLQLGPPDRPVGRQVVIDLFFRTLALVHRDRSVGIVLSGTGADGAVGIRALKENGGVVLVQSPEDAEYDGMPRAAIATRAVDWVLPVAEMPQKLLELWKNARKIRLPPPGDDTPIHSEPPDTPEAADAAEEALRDIMVLLRSRTGHDFRHYKRATVLRRLERRLQVSMQPDLPAYRTFLSDTPQEADALLKDMLIGVTNFFRDRDAFEALERGVLPRLFESDGPAPRAPLRVWTAGCSTGEEAYSVAMLLTEYAGTVSQPPDIQVFATDIDEHAIGTARAGVYPEAIVTDVAPARLRQFFDKDGDRFRVRKDVRERVLFALHNILRDPPFSKLDLITCRNLLIYLKREAHPEILEMFHFALRPGGYLFLGGSESADAASPYFSVVDKKHRIYQANPGVRPARYGTSVSMGARELRPAPVQASARPPVNGTRTSFSELHQRLAEHHAPPSVLIDGQGNIVHLSERAGRFLRQPGGVPSHHLISLVRPELRLALRTAFYQAAQTGKSVEARRVRLTEDGEPRIVNMIVRPVHEPEVAGSLVLVLFDEVQDTLAQDSADGAASPDPLVQQLEAELRQTKEQLQDTIEQSETSTEELKASNEELQAMNEELRSATEELETSKEELQSINEELTTVNHELKTKVEETDQVNDDLQNLIASTDLATLFVDRALAIKRYTPRATDIFRLIPTDVGRSLLDIQHQVDYAELVSDVTETLQSLHTREREVHGPDDRWYLARVVPYRTNEDRIDGAVLTFIDITSRRAAEERLRLGEERMRLVAESTKDYAIITLDVDGRIATWNAGAERMFGHDAAVIGEHVAILFQPEDRAAGVPEEELRRARADGRAEDDRWHVRRDGSRFFCSGITSPMVEHGRLQGYAKIARDRTDIKQAELDRDARLEWERKARAKAFAESESKNEFLAVMSHELKNPLNLIQLNAELLSRLPEARALPLVAKAAQTIQKTVLSQAKIIDDLLDMSRVTTGKLALQRVQFPLCEAAEAIVSATRDDATSRGVSVAFEKHDAPVEVWGDPGRLEQVVWNLVSNALKFTPAGGQVTVDVAREDRFARVEVADTGRGIAPDFLPLVFDLFRQAEGRTTRKEGGLGIGLALVKSIMDLHGGRVRAESPGEGQGSTFTVWVPLATQPRPAEPPPAPRAARLTGLKVLVVDDDAEGVEALHTLLTIEGADVTKAHRAAEALALLRHPDQRFDLVVSDIAMPEMDGYALVEAVRRDPGGATLPIVAMTGFGRAADVARARVAGFDAHVTKPLDLRRLHDAIAEAMAVRAGSA